MSKATAPRSLSSITRDIKTSWPKPYFGAVPYIAAMYKLDSIDDNFMHDSARSIVRYFLSNAATWRGDSARVIKAELKAMVGDK